MVLLPEMATPVQMHSMTPHLLLSCRAVTPVACVRTCALGMVNIAAPRCWWGAVGSLMWHWMKPSDQPDSSTSGEAATLSADTPFGSATRHSRPSICLPSKQHKSTVMAATTFSWKGVILTLCAVYGV
jgi:hypothetical protein